MKGLRFLFVALMVFSILFLGKYYGKDFRRKHISKSSYKPMASYAASEEKRFVIVIPSYNNAAYIERNLTSVVTQNYENYRVIYIDDCSTDETCYLAEKFIEEHSAQDKFTVIQNSTNQKALYNLYYAIHSAANDEIIVLLDGDDELSHKGVLTLLNQYYNDEDVWMTYGQYVTYPKYKKGMCRETYFNSLQRGKVRKAGLFSQKGEWVFSHLRTFYAGLFKRIQLKDLLYEGKFFSSSWDLAIMYPMLEMSREHAVFIPDVLYIYNRETPLNDDKLRKKEQLFFNDYIRSFPPYPKLESSPKSEIVSSSGASLLVFSEDRPMQLYALLESLEKYVSRFSKTVIYYKANDEVSRNAYLAVEERFRSHYYIVLRSDDKTPLRDRVIKTIEDLEEKYLAIADDGCVIKDIVNIDHSIQLIEKTGAFGFYYLLGLNIHDLPERMIPVGSGCFAWDLTLGTSDWEGNKLLKMTLLKTSDVKALLKKQRIDTLRDFTHFSANLPKEKQMGICCKSSKAALIPMQMTKVDSGEEIALYTQNELSEYFLEGYKIDISTLFQMENRSPRLEYYPRFILRELPEQLAASH